MNFGTIALKTVIVLVILFLLSLAGALTFPAAGIFSGGGAGLASLLYLILAMLILSVVGNLLGRGIRTIKKPLDGLILTFVGAFFIGSILAIFAILNIPYAVRLNLNWLGTSWYSPLLSLLFIGTPLMLVYTSVE
jgi:hypothetical protein